MNANGEHEAIEAAGTPPEQLVWRVWLMRRSPPLKSAAAAVVVVVSLVAAMHVVGNAFVVGVYAVVLLAAIGEFVFPVEYRLDTAGAAARSWYGTVRVPWSRVKRLRRSHDGLKLSVYGQDAPLERFRGLYLRFEDNADEVVGFARRFAGGGEDVQRPV